MRILTQLFILMGLNGTSFIESKAISGKWVPSGNENISRKSAKQEIEKNIRKKRK